MSTDLPAWMWQDPARVAERIELDALGCQACRSDTTTIGRRHCDDARNERQQGHPSIGHRCRWFDER